MTLAIHLDRSEAASLQDQLFEQLRQLIRTGRLKPNSRVIATRFLADQLGVSRTTVLLAYERLISEGYLETRPSVGTFVSTILPDPLQLKSASKAAACHTTSHCNGFQVAPPHRPNPDDWIDFSPQHFDSSHLLGDKVWLQFIRNVLEREPNGFGNSHGPAGAPALRKAVVDQLAATRGIMTTPEQVIIVTGRQQACALIAHIFQQPGDRVVVENPGDRRVISLFTARGADLVHVPVDEQGLETDHLPSGRAALAYVTPSRQNPVGGTLPQARRDALLHWAHAAGAHLIEDDSDSEFRYHGTTPPPLAAIDPYGLVFYFGSFSKTLGAGVGLGYLVVPAEFIDAVLAIKSKGHEGGSWLEQMVVANLIADGGYDHHLRRVRKIYLARRDCLIASLRAHFGEVRLLGAELGSQLTWLLPDHFPPAETFCEAARAQGINLEPLNYQNTPSSRLCRLHNKALILGYGALTPDRLETGVSRLAGVSLH